MVRIVVPAKCYCCQEIKQMRNLEKPTRLARSFTSDCDKCGSITTFRMKVKGQDLRIETVFVSATEEGVKEYESRTNKKFESNTFARIGNNEHKAE